MGALCTRLMHVLTIVNVLSLSDTCNGEGQNIISAL